MGHGTNGTAGQPGTWDEAGADGEDGIGGLVWADTISINEQQAFTVTIGQETTFGVYSSANGKRYANGYTDVRSGESYGRSAVPNPRPGYGEGGAKGTGGTPGARHKEKQYRPDGSPAGSRWVIDVEPGEGTNGSNGSAGCVIVYYDK